MIARIPKVKRDVDVMGNKPDDESEDSEGSDDMDKNGYTLLVSAGNVAGELVRLMRTGSIFIGTVRTMMTGVSAA